ncbi:SRPBCC family protein [Boseongicola sp. H5]|uniref:SRPBCC family protein n=1 Tax=Boseongicola sp. H5 TaxID=2763261 RepID=UPI001D0AB929|nr:SRPBCC family protein [Boseongicola sp. H5]
MTTRPLRTALTANLVFSTLCGVALIVSGREIGVAMGALPGWFMTVLGVGLLGFGALIAFVLARLRIGWALIISGLDLLWVASTLPLLAVPGLLTADGRLIVLLVAAVVAVLGFFQMRGIRTILAEGQDEEGIYRHCVRLYSRAKPDALWAVIRDLGSISRYSTGLKASRLEGGSVAEPGAVRVCTNQQGQSWAEEVVSMDDPSRTVVLRFRAEAEDFPFPLDEMIGGWTVTPAANGTSTVDIWWSVRPTRRRLGWVLLALMTIPLDRDIRHIVAAMEAEGSGKSAGSMMRLPVLGYC